MLVYLLLIAGVYALFAKRVGVTKNTEIRRPQTFYFTTAVLVGVVVFLIGAGNTNIDLKIFLASCGFLIPIISAIYLKKPKLTGDIHSIEKK